MPETASVGGQRPDHVPRTDGWTAVSHCGSLHGPVRSRGNGRGRLCVYNLQ